MLYFVPVTATFTFQKQEYWVNWGMVISNQPPAVQTRNTWTPGVGRVAASGFQAENLNPKSLIDNANLCVSPVLANTLDHIASCNGLVCVCEVSAVNKISDWQQGGPGFNPRPGRGLNFGRPSFATPLVDRGVNPLVWSLGVLSGD